MQSHAQRKWLAYILVFCAVFATVLLVGENSGPSGPTTRVLFIGNSFTSVNNVPNQFKEIAESKGHDVYAMVRVDPGATLRQHAQNQDTLNVIAAESWDYVVLQEQSQKFAFGHEQIERESNAYARKLASHIRSHAPNTKIVFYQTWADPQGDAINCPIDPPLCSYAGTQQRLNANYRAIATELKASVAPVGEAWSRVRTAHPQIALYSGDAHHQSKAGAYLAGCVFYHVIFRDNCSGATYNDIDSKEAVILQQITDSLPNS